MVTLTLHYYSSLVIYGISSPTNLLVEVLLEGEASLVQGGSDSSHDSKPCISGIFTFFLEDDEVGLVRVLSVFDEVTIVDKNVHVGLEAVLVSGLLHLGV